MKHILFKRGIEEQKDCTVICNVSLIILVICIFYTAVPNTVFRHVEDQIIIISSSLAISPTGHGTWGVLGRADVLLRAASQRVHTTVTDLKDAEIFQCCILKHHVRLRLLFEAEAAKR